MSTATITPDELEEFQYSSPTGGFVQSDWMGCRHIEIGMLVRHTGGWAQVTDVLPDERHPEHRLVQVAGRWQIGQLGFEVRTDCRVAP